MSILYRLLFAKLTLPSPSVFKEKTVLITGANTGLGREAARHALALGAGTIIMGVRTLSKGEEAKADIESSTGCTDRKRVLVWPIDLESFASVQAFAARTRKYVVEEGGRLDMAIMNAGLASGEFALTSDGWERTFQINVLSTALLSLQLLPLLLRTREQNPSTTPHLTIVASDIYSMVKFRERNNDPLFPTLNNKDSWKKSQAAGGPVERYALTKLLDFWITMELARLTPRDEHGHPLVVVNAVAPGFCKSDLLTREKAPLMLKIVQTLVARKVEEGSKTLIDGVAHGEESHGKWLESQIITEPGALVTGADAAVIKEKVWREIIATLKKVDPELRTEF
ncbi:hypothetical protein M426DRAFT_14503 [Hypoxylon sp. CI-4A]|nr:hypothetical protein M426DRAFT_14503 [Hypoxylon sp. CI-4A]